MKFIKNTLSKRICYQHIYEKEMVFVDNKIILEAGRG